MQVKEASNRLAQLYTDKPHLRGAFSADFIATQKIGDEVWLDERGPYDAVTCMFALHYFFSSQRSAENAIEMAAKNLKPGGYFFGVLPDGKNVSDTIGPSVKVRSRI